MKTLAIVLFGLAILIPSASAQQAQPAVAAVKAKAEAQQAETKQPDKEPLSEKEQSDLARRAEEPGREVAGGALSNLHLTYIVIALAAAVIVLVAK